MNFPSTQRTGQLAELEVHMRFTSWSWTVGKDWIDTGYDLFVEPDLSIFNGSRFLVQVKATTRTNSGRVARVGKKRLREYAKNPIPVFLLWRSADGTLHWMHIQPWILANSKRLSGDGEAGVPIPSGQKLDDKDEFVAYLRDVLKPLGEKIGSLSQLALERSRYLSSIDPRFDVRVGLKSGAESYEVSARSDSVKVGMAFRAGERSAEVVEAIKYGLPVSVDVDTFRATGSTLFDELGLNGSRGQLSIEPNQVCPGQVTIFPGCQYSMLAKSVSISSNLYSGSGGFAIKGRSAEDVVDLSVRGDLGADGGLRISVTANLIREALGSVPVADIHLLGDIADCARECLTARALYFELSFRGERQKLIVDGDQFTPLADFFLYVVALGRLHKTARALGSSFLLKGDESFSTEDLLDVHFAYKLLKGEMVRVDVGPIDVYMKEAANNSEIGAGVFRIQTEIEFSLFGRRLGSVPVILSLKGFRVEATSDRLRCRLVKGDAPEACLQYDYSESFLGVGT